MVERDQNAIKTRVGTVLSTFLCCRRLQLHQHRRNSWATWRFADGHWPPRDVEKNHKMEVETTKKPTDLGIKFRIILQRNFTWKQVYEIEKSQRFQILSHTVIWYSVLSHLCSPSRSILCQTRISFGGSALIADQNLNLNLNTDGDSIVSRTVGILLPPLN